MDIVDSKTRSRIMRSIKGRNTQPEMLVRKALRSRGIRYRLHAGDLPGNPDIVNRGRRIAVQVRGCFWHQHSCKDGRRPASNHSYWIPKLERTVARDFRNAQELRAMQYKLFVIWECTARNE